MARSGDESCSQSSIGLEPVHLSPYTPHPQSWTVVPEYNMGVRQQRTHDMHGHWKYDVHCQIANLSEKLNESLEEFPDNRKRGLEIPWRPTVDRPTRDDLPLYQQNKASFSPAIPPPSREQTEEFYRNHGMSNATNSLAFGLGRSSSSR